MLDVAQSLRYNSRMRNTTFRPDVLDEALHDRKLPVVARKAGVSRQALWAYRRGMYAPSREIANRIAEALDIHPLALYP